MKFISIDDNIDEKDYEKVEDNSKMAKPSDITKIKNYCKNVSQSYNCDIEDLSYENINTDKIINLIPNENKPYIFKNSMMKPQICLDYQIYLYFI